MRVARFFGRVPIFFSLLGHCIRSVCVAYCPRYHRSRRGVGAHVSVCVSILRLHIGLVHGFIKELFDSGSQDVLPEALPYRFVGLTGTVVGLYRFSCSV